MEINFSNTEVIFIYGKFKKEIRKLEELKETPGCPFSADDIDKDIALYTSLTKKLKEAVPNLSKMDAYRF